MLSLFFTNLVALAYVYVRDILGDDCVKSVSELFLHVYLILVVVVKRAVTLIEVKTSEYDTFLRILN